jgi:uncharacterized membrane protein YgcG
MAGRPLVDIRAHKRPVGSSGHAPVGWSSSVSRQAGRSSAQPVHIDLEPIIPPTIRIDLDDEPRPKGQTIVDVSEPGAKRHRAENQRLRPADESESLRRQLAAAQAELASKQAQLAASVAREGEALERERSAKANAEELVGQLGRAVTSVRERNAELHAMRARQLMADEQRRDAEPDPRPFLRALEAQRVSAGRMMGALQASAERHRLTVQILAEASGKALSANDRRILSSPAGSCWREEDGQMSSVWHMSIKRENLGEDLLRELQRLSTPFSLFCKPHVTFEGEPGVDERGLTVNLFAKAFGALRDLHKPAGGGETAASSLGGKSVAAGAAAGAGVSRPGLLESFPSGLNLPARDPASGAASSEGSTGGRGSLGTGSSQGGGSSIGGGGTSGEGHGGQLGAGLGSVSAWRLIGRLLAWQLRQPEGLYVDDKLPHFLLEYLTTGEAVSLGTIDGALQAVGQMHGEDGVLGYCSKCLTMPVEELAFVIGGEPTLSDMLPHGYWSVCHATADAKACACSSTALSDEGKETAFLSAIRHTYLDSRRSHLRALKEGFNARDGAEACVPDWGPVLRFTPPSAMAVRLRGKAVKDGAALWGKMIVMRQERDDKDARWRKATEEDYTRVIGWLEEYVSELGASAARLLLLFVTGAGALAPGCARRLSVLVYNDWDNPNSTRACFPTASACAWQLYLPVYPSKDVFLFKLGEAIENFRRDEMSRNGAGFGYR